MYSLTSLYFKFVLESKKLHVFIQSSSWNISRWSVDEQTT
jgi:hypothetical protein